MQLRMARIFYLTALVALAAGCWNNARPYEGQAGADFAEHTDSFPNNSTRDAYILEQGLGMRLFQIIPMSEVGPLLLSRRNTIETCT